MLKMNSKHKGKAFIKSPKAFTAKTLFAVLSMLIIPIYTIKYGTTESPLENTLSGIGTFSMDHYYSFILWGIITGGSIVAYTMYVFKKTDFANKRARRYLYASDIFLVLTVITPAAKDLFPFWHFLHVVYSVLFALFLVISLLLFIQYLSVSDKKLSKRALALFLSCIGISLIALFLMGLNGLVEILFFIGITIFLFILSIVLNSFHEADYHK